MIRGWLREPLVHFLLAGAAIYVLIGWFGNPYGPTDRTIVIDAGRKAEIAAGFERMMGRAPTDSELDGLVKRWLREEVLYREGLRLGLDADDPVVRRRLATKMDELAAASAETAGVSDATLENWLETHPERFVDGGTVSLDQAWYASEETARAALASGRVVGNPISLPRSVEAMPRAEMREVFGLQFAEELAKLAPAPDWQGPIPSGFGWHLVRLRARDVGSVPPLAEIRQQVEADWRSETIVERRERAYRVLRDAYSVRQP
ncbi:peptidylprolyl isomerase [Erythrobacter sp.]|uniref:peptidylprolyl isomerase n=1 Tax=Erythrobacter sp. TaxID=1042 RepID=UPI00311E2F41